MFEAQRCAVRIPGLYRPGTWRCGRGSLVLHVAQPAHCRSPPLPAPVIFKSGNYANASQELSKRPAERCCLNMCMAGSSSESLARVHNQAWLQLPSTETDDPSAITYCRCCPACTLFSFCNSWLTEDDASWRPKKTSCCRYVSFDACFGSCDTALQNAHVAEKVYSQTARCRCCTVALVHFHWKQAKVRCLIAPAQSQPARLNKTTHMPGCMQRTS